MTLHNHSYIPYFLGMNMGVATTTYTTDSVRTSFETFKTCTECPYKLSGLTIKKRENVYDLEKIVKSTQPWTSVTQVTEVMLQALLPVTTVCYRGTYDPTKVIFYLKQ